MDFFGNLNLGTGGKSDNDKEVVGVGDMIKNFTDEVGKALKEKDKEIKRLNGILEELKKTFETVTSEQPEEPSSEEPSSEEPSSEEPSSEEPSSEEPSSEEPSSEEPSSEEPSPEEPSPEEPSPEEPSPEEPSSENKENETEKETTGGYRYKRRKRFTSVKRKRNAGKKSGRKSSKSTLKRKH